MGRSLDDIISSLPLERQARIASLSQRKVDEMIAHAATLADFRKAVGKTQMEVAKQLGINQNAVSQLEGRTDIYFSTLRRFLKSLGMTLELAVLSENGTRIELPNFLRLQDSNEQVPLDDAMKVSDPELSHEQVFGQLAVATFSATEAANYLEVSISTFRRLVTAGKLTASIEAGNKQRFSTKDLRALKRSRQENRGPKSTQDAG